MLYIKLYIVSFSLWDLPLSGHVSRLPGYACGDTVKEQHMETAFPQPSSVTVVAPGLNTRPEAMEPLIEWLRQQGSETFLVQLSSQYEERGGASGLALDKSRKFTRKSDSEDGSEIGPSSCLSRVKSRNGFRLCATLWLSIVSNLRRVARGGWGKAFEEAYDKALARSQEVGVPLYFLGFSLGALVAQHAMSSSGGEVRFDKQVLLAPALALRSRSYLLKAAFFLPEHWLLPSKTPEAYRANRGTSIRAYKALFRQQKAVRKGRFRRLNIPTLVIIDPRDELISLSKLKKYIARFGLDNYRILELDPKGAAGYHHLIVDERSMGPTNWDKATAAINAHLFAGR
ncbi:MAG: hypothetical protein J5I94_07885 [Phaeodactylibacter sp.]|nr:hypothetical protein [Phaeodactylibacter sp.]